MEISNSSRRSEMPQVHQCLASLYGLLKLSSSAPARLTWGAPRFRAFTRHSVRCRPTVKKGYFGQNRLFAFIARYYSSSYDFE